MPLHLPIRVWIGRSAEDPALKKGVNILNKKVTYRAVAEAFNMECSEL